MPPTYITELQRVIHEEGRKQSWLAGKVGIDQAYLSRIVRGLHCPDDLKRAIADALGRKPADLWPGAEPLEEIAA